MKPGIALLDQLSDEDADWVLATAVERHHGQGETVIEAGEAPETLYLVLQGLLGVYADEVDTQLAVLGPSDLAGEMSFLEDHAPTESVRAIERSLTLALPFSALRERLDGDPAFAARLYRVFAQVLAARLRQANGRLSTGVDQVVSHDDLPAWQRLAEPLQELQAAALHVEEVASADGDEVPEDLAADFLERFLAYCALFHQVLSEDIDNPRVKEEVGLRVQQALLPYILLTETAKRFYSKPRGYAGDFWTIELVYRNEPAGATPLGALIDRCVLETPAARAVRNRRGLLTEEIERTIGECQGRQARITTLACGPARELFDAFAGQQDAPALHATLLDIDSEALAFVREQAEHRGLEDRFTLQQENLVHLALGRVASPVQDQDLVYSIGLIDYFGDELVVRLMDLIHTMLRPGGRVILGNMHPDNSTRALLDHVLDWEVIHRMPEDMDRLYASSDFGRPSTNIRIEEEGANLFAECIR